MLLNIERAKRGFVLPLVIFAIVAMTFFLFFVNFMGSGYSRQVAHVDEFTRCRAICESVFSVVIARIRNKPWKERFFLNKSFSISNDPILSGEYDLLVEDTPGKQFQADVFILGKYRNIKRLYFWRIRYEDTILDATGKMYPIIFTGLDAGKSPIKDGPSVFRAHIEKILSQRNDNKKAACTVGGAIRSLSSLKDIIKVMNGPPFNEVPEATDPVIDTQAPPVTSLPPASPVTPPTPEDDPDAINITSTELVSALKAYFDDATSTRDGLNDILESKNVTAKTTEAYKSIYSALKNGYEALKGKYGKSGGTSVREIKIKIPGVNLNTPKFEFLYQRLLDKAKSKAKL